MKKLNLWSLLMLMAIAVATLSSCSKHSKTLDFIPADADFVVGINVADVLENAGCEKKDGAVLMAGPLAKLMNLGGEEGTQARAFFEGGFIDLDGVFITGSFSGDVFMMASVKDEDQLRRYFKDNDWDVDHAGGFSYARRGKYGPAIFWDENILAASMQSWRDVDRQLAPIKEMMRRAEKRPLSEVGWKADILSSKHAAGAYVALENLPSIIKSEIRKAGAGQAAQLLDCSLCATLDLSGSKAEFRLSYRDTDGKQCEMGKEYMKYLRKIDTGMLEYLNRYDVAMAACGLSGDMPWKEILEPIATASRDKDAKEGIAMVLPYLQAWDGTFIVAGGPRKGIESLSASERQFNDNWDIVAAVQLKPGKATQFTNDLRTLVEGASNQYSGENYEYDPVQQTFVAVPAHPMVQCAAYSGNGLKIDFYNGPTVYVKPEGNTLVAATRDIAKGDSPAIKKDLVSGQQSVLVADLPKDYSILKHFGASWGLRLVSKIDSGETLTTLELSGADKPLLESILSLVL